MVFSRCLLLTICLAISDSIPLHAFCPCPAGVLGTLAGGLVLDRAGSSLRNALLLCAAGTAAGFLLIAAGFLLVGSFGPFAVVLSAGEFAMFMTQVSPTGVHWRGRGLLQAECGTRQWMTLHPALPLDSSCALCDLLWP